MKTKMVIWGSNEKDEKILLALELQHEENKVNIHTFPAASVTEVFYNQMMNLWRNGGPVTFPDDVQTITRELSMTDDLLPEHIRVERTDLINRAKTEWHFVVLSSKLRESYYSEIQDFKDKVEALTNFDAVVWDDLKAFWVKVQGQIREKNLFREHADELRDNTNELFTKLKNLKKSLNEEFNKISKEHTDSFMTILKSIEQKVNDGLGLHPLFNELKDLQNKFNNTDFTRSDRSTVWKKLDATFKLVKEKKFGPAGNDNNSLNRVNSRYNGLMAAIKKMENSIHRDKKDIEFQNNRIQTTDGQLEMQIRQAKLSMIQQRIGSKEEKLAEMMSTKEFIEKKLEQEKKKQQKRDAQQAAQQEKAKATKPAEDKSAQQAKPTADSKPTEAKPAVQEKPRTIAAAAEPTIQENQKPATDAAESKSTLQENQKAATDAKPTAEGMLAKQDPSEEPSQITTAGAVAAGTVVAGGAVVSGKAEPSLNETIEDTIDTIEDTIEDMFDTVKAAASVLIDKVEEIVESLTEEE